MTALLRLVLRRTLYGRVDHAITEAMLDWYNFGPPFFGRVRGAIKARQGLTMGEVLYELFLTEASLISQASVDGAAPELLEAAICNVMSKSKLSHHEGWGIMKISTDTKIDDKWSVQPGPLVHHGQSLEVQR